MLKKLLRENPLEGDNYAVFIPLQRIFLVVYNLFFF